MNKDFGNWLAGLTDGEGSFSLWFTAPDRCEPQFVIAQRADNIALLQHIREETALGYITVSQQGRQNPMALWVVRGVADCLQVVDIFHNYPLRGTKAEVFALWAIAVEKFLADEKIPPKALHEAIKQRKHFRSYKFTAAASPKQLYKLQKRQEALR